MADQSLYDRLGGVFAIAAVVEHFSDAVVKNATAGQRSANPALRDWHTSKLARLPGLKFMRTLWLCHVAGGPFEYEGTKPGRSQTSLEEAHRELRISPEEFDATRPSWRDRSMPSRSLSARRTRSSPRSRPTRAR